LPADSVATQKKTRSFRVFLFWKKQLTLKQKFKHGEYREKLGVFSVSL